MGDVDVAGGVTIDELARRAGMTARNIRAYQSRGLIPPPEIRGRTGYYGPVHEARIQLIRELQEAGFNLEAIRKLLDVAPGVGVEEALRFGTALLVPWAPEEPEIVEAEDLARRFGTLDPEAVRRGAELGVLTPLEDGRFRVDSPTLLRAGEQVVALGVPLAEALAVMEEVARDADAVARTFVRLFLEHIWGPFEAAGHPPEQWERIRKSVDRLNPIASTVLMTAFQRRMAEDIQKAVGDELSAPEVDSGATPPGTPP
jgi:DNA-binding transcriptional MerR regulator